MYSSSLSLTSTLCGGGWSTTCLGHFSSDTHYEGGWVDLGACLHEYKNLSRAPSSKPEPSGP